MHLTGACNPPGSQHSPPLGQTDHTMTAEVEDFCESMKQARHLLIWSQYHLLSGTLRHLPPPPAGFSKGTNPASYTSGHRQQGTGYQLLTFLDSSCTNKQQAPTARSFQLMGLAANHGSTPYTPWLEDLSADWAPSHQGAPGYMSN